jgi:hypothetical protein
VREGRNGMNNSLVVGSSRWKGRRVGKSSMIAGISRLNKWKGRGAENGGAVKGVGAGAGEEGGGVGAVSLGVELFMWAWLWCTYTWLADP